MIYVAVAAYALLFATLAGNVLYLRRHVPGRQPEAFPSVSVLIPARNEAAVIRRLLASLQTQNYPSFEVFIYDDASTDGTSDAVADFLSDERFHLERGNGPPDGWVGKVHALYRLTRSAPGDLFLFLDADVELMHPNTLARLIGAFERLPPRSVATSLPRLRGGGLLLVSVIPFVLLTMLPWMLVRRVPVSRMGAVSGHCWIIRADDYRQAEPHLHVRNEVLEDIRIGQYLRSLGIVPVLLDLRAELEVRMYGTLGEAVRGLSKNAYPMAGGHPLAFIPLVIAYGWLFLFMPAVYPWLFAASYVLKITADVVARMPVVVSILAPIAYLLAAAVQLLSAFLHWTGRVEWKGRRLGSRQRI